MGSERGFFESGAIKFQTSSSNLDRHTSRLEFVAWSFSGTWNLGIGTFGRHLDLVFPATRTCSTFQLMRILSGIQPSGALHLGNYFGMMKPAIELQEKGEAFYFIADYHSMTSLFDAEQRRKNTLDVALDFLACGLDPKKAVFFKQSDVPEVTELAWILTTLTPMGLLERGTS